MDSFIKSTPNYLKTTLYILISLTIIFVSLYALFYSGLSFDGAFHSQAAINFYKSGKYMLDYPIGFTQIKVPFQLINGLFLTLFGTNFIAANLANVLFYIFFAYLLFILHKQFDSQLILIGLILISFSHGVVDYGFKGYGELPVLVFGLYGLFFITRVQNSLSGFFLGGLLIGTAIATKWVFVLILLPFGLFLLFQLINKRIKILATIIFGFVVALFIFWFIEYINYSVNIMKLLRGIATHSVPVNEHYYAGYAERLLVFWHKYVRNSGSNFLAILKVIAYFQLILLSVFSLGRIVKSIKSKQTISTNQFFVFLISVFAVEYILWWFFLASKPWYRRCFVADILLVVALSLSTKNIFFNKPIKKLFNYLTFVIIVVLLISNVYYFFSKKSNQLFSINGKEEIILESQLRAGLNSMPENYIPFGYGWWQAPRWSFLSGNKHRDLLTLPLEERLKIENGAENYFVFFEPENMYEMNSYHKIHNLFKLSTVFEYNNYSIKQIIGKKDTSKVFSLINYLDYDYSKTSGVYRREKNFCWYSQNAEVLLNSKNKTDFILSYFIPDINKYPNPLIITIYFSNDLVYKKNIISSGKDIIKFKVPKKYNQNLLLVKVKLSSAVITKGDGRNLGIPVRKIGFK